MPVHQVARRRRARQRDHVDCDAAPAPRAAARGSPADGTVRYAVTSVTCAPCSLEPVGQQRRRDVGASQQHSGARRSWARKPSRMLSVTNSAGIQSAVMPRDARAAAVLGPIAQIRTPASARLSCPDASSRSQKASTPFVLVKTIQANCPTSRRAASNGAGSSTGSDLDGRILERDSAKLDQARREGAGLLACPRHQHAQARERQPPAPVQRLTQADHVSDDQHGGRPQIRGPDPLDDVAAACRRPPPGRAWWPSGSRRPAGRPGGRARRRFSTIDSRCSTPIRKISVSGPFARPAQRIDAFVLGRGPRGR